MLATLHLLALGFITSVVVGVVALELSTRIAESLARRNGYVPQDEE